MERVRMVRETMDIVEKRPILGLGFDSYRFYTQSPLKRISSDYFQFLANTGILGLFAYLCFLGVAMKKNNQSSERFGR
jgi:O-antigen ligase